MKSSFQTAYDYLNANMKELSKDEDLEEYDIKSQVVNPADAEDGDDTEVAFLVSVISSILSRPVRSSLVVLGSMSIMGEVNRVQSLVDQLQLAIDAGADQVLLPAENKSDFGMIPDEVLDELELVFYTDPINAASKAMDIE
jgi:ATP-dependent Lon protease